MRPLTWIEPSQRLAVRRHHAARSCSTDRLSDKISRTSPGFNPSSALVIRSKRPSVAERSSASMLAVEEFEIIDRLEKNLVTVHLWPNPLLETFHIHNPAVGRP